MAKVLNKDEFDKEVINSKDTVLVDFYADWCGPCRMLGPVLDEISKEKKVFKVNVDDEAELAQQYGIMSIPCMILFKDGNEDKRLIGLHPKSEIMELFK